MSMVTPESIAHIKSIVDAKQGDHISIHKTVLRGIIGEIEQLQATQNVDEQRKLDLVQKLTLDFTVQSMYDALIDLSKQDFGNMTPGEAVVFAAEGFKKSFAERDIKPEGNA